MTTYEIGDMVYYRASFEKTANWVDGPNRVKEVLIGDKGSVYYVIESGSNKNQIIECFNVNSEKETLQEVINKERYEEQNKELQKEIDRHIKSIEHYKKEIDKLKQKIK